MASRTLAAVLCFNRPDLMASINRQMGHNLCVVDNGSANPLNYGGHAMHVRFEQNRFWTGGWNRAIKLFKELEFEWVWMLNSDIQGVSSDMMSRMETLLEALPDALAISPTFNSPHSHMWSQGRAEPRQVNWLDMPAPLMHIGRFLEMGGFDEDFIGYGSDIDFCRRAYGQYKFYVVDALAFTHGGGETAVSEGITAHTDLSLMNKLLHDKWGVNEYTEMFNNV